MFDETSFRRSVEAAGPDELAEIFRRPPMDEEKSLRAYLGDERYQRMHLLALRRNIARARSKPSGNVVVIPDFMGSNLAAVGRDGVQEEVWLNPRLLATGEFQRLRLAEDGRSSAKPDNDIRACGVMKCHYGELLLSLSGRWNVRSFWFDWRKDVRLAAAQLEVNLRSWFADGTAVHLVGHGLGGLVARAFIDGHPKRWDALWDRQGVGVAGGRIIMVGTPNRGSFVALQSLMGIDPLVGKLIQLDGRQNPIEVRQILNSFVGTYQMLPAPGVAGAEALYSSTTYPALAVTQRHLDDARQLHEALTHAVDAARMVNVAGDGHPTPSGIKDLDKLHQPDGYEVSLNGDGRVPHELGHLQTSDGQPVPTYYVAEDHGNLISSPAVLTAIDELLETGKTDELAKRPSGRGDERVETPDNDDFDRMLSRLRNKSAAVSLEDRRVGEFLTRGLLSSSAARQTKPSIPIKPATLHVALVHGRIDELDKTVLDGLPVDAIAVGHYLGVRPQMAELALDRAISQTLPGRVTPVDSPLLDADLLITQLAERGILRGELGQPFFLPDPRPGPDGRPGGRLIAIAGMGVPGRFGLPELTVLSRELCWSLGRIGRKHLATVLIGAGVGNLSPRDAVAAWLRGAKNALSGSLEDDERRICRITFVEADTRKLQQIQDGILVEQSRLRKRDRLKLEFEPMGDARLGELLAAVPQEVQAARNEKLSEPAPTRLTVSLHKSTYRFGAITETASIPEREIPIDPALVMRANSELAAETDPEMQAERGQFMERLLVPEDLRSELYTAAPLVISLDATTARIHWELLSQPEFSTARGGGAPAEDGETGHHRLEAGFLSTSRGLTRQLRTTFAPPPEPPPPPRRLLRVLVVADPAEDAPLLGAEEEGANVVELFEAFNRVYETISANRVEVVSMFGPREASRTNVLRHLVLRSFDVLHFAGHCVYVRDDPDASGWLFSNGELLATRELSRIDRIPRFVFSNACESGVTPDRSDLRSVELAPSFAEAFFKRGVANFVCTAWPVDDVAAREFALALYSRLLGLEITVGKSAHHHTIEPQLMHKALAEARYQIASKPYGVGTWGAYQHYGNPYFRFFDVSTLRITKATDSAAPAELTGDGHGKPLVDAGTLSAGSTG
jgi:hypothetical protein